MEPNTHSPAQGTNPQTSTENTTAGRPKRRRIQQPCFSTRLFRARLGGTALLLALGLTLHAQNVPTPATNPTGQDLGSTPQPVTPQRGWTMFDDRVAGELQMPPEQLARLRAVDERYLGEYKALGNEPMNDPRYQELTDRRNAEIREVMSEPMYTTWETKFQPVPNTIQDQRTGGIPPPPVPPQP